MPFQVPCACGPLLAVIIRLMSNTPRSTEAPAWRPAALLLTVFGVIARLLPHPPNFAPVGATSVFAGARLPMWQAYLVPLALMAITDPILAGFYHVPVYSKYQLFAYASFVI